MILTKSLKLLSLLAIAALSLAGSLVFPLSDLGRAAPNSVSRQWLGLLLAWWVVLVGWALLYAVIHHRLTGKPWHKSLRAAALGHSPLVLGFGLAAALYASDPFNHLFTNMAYGQVILQPLAKAYLFAAPAAVQVALILGWRRIASVRVPAMAAVLLVGLALRVWNINWGLPALFHPDEHQYVGRAFLMMATGDPNPHYFENPSLMIYLTDAFYLLLGQQAQAFHVVADALGMQLLDPRGDYLVVLASRTTVALAGTLTILFIYLAGRDMLGRRAALLGSALLAVGFLHVRNSHYGTNDVVATALVTLSFLFSTRIYSRGRLRYYLLAGLFGGLGTAAKYNVGFFVAPLLVAHVARLYKGSQGVALKRDLLPLLSSAVASAVAFWVATPYSLLDFPTFWTDFRAQYGYGASQWLGQQVLPSPLLYLTALVQGFGLVPLALALLGIVLVWRRNRWVCAVLLSMPAVYLLFMFAQKLFFARFAIPTLPFLALLAGYALSHLEGYWQRLPRPQLLTYLALAAVLAQPVAMSVRSDFLLGQEDTRSIAAAWIENNAAKGNSIAMDGYAEEDDEFHWTSYGGSTTFVYWPENPQLRAAAIGGNYGYVVVSSFGYGPWQPEVGPASLIPPQFQTLQSLGQLVASFGPASDNNDVPFSQDDMYTPFWHLFDRERPGPTVKIFRMPSAR